jgi:hypothetical protein
VDWWYILGGIFLGWSIPWAILQISDGMFLLNQLFRLTFWSGFLIAYELAELNMIYCYLLAHIPGVIIWACYDYWFDENDEPQKIGDNYECGIPIESMQKSGSPIVLPSPQILSPQVG